MTTLNGQITLGQSISGSVGKAQGMGGAIGGILANLGTGWIVENFSYTPLFVIAGLMHPMSAWILTRLLPEREFQKAAARIRTGIKG